jgi:hypothetical protein
MVDERGRDKNRICSGGRTTKNKMRDNYQFILLARASHFLFVCNTISIHEDLGRRRDWRTCRIRRGILDASKKFR